MLSLKSNVRLVIATYSSKKLHRLRHIIYPFTWHSLSVENESNCSYHFPLNLTIKNRKRRDELQHNVFLMLQETNKFREHQSRELLIEILEKQNSEREKLIKELEDKIEQSEALLMDATSSNLVTKEEAS